MGFQVMKLATGAGAAILLQVQAWTIAAVVADLEVDS